MFSALLLKCYALTFLFASSFQKLAELGVERLVLPAVSSVLDTWTKSFGFSVMKESERLNFLDYTFLEFRETIMCQKLLKDPSSTVLTLPPGKLGDPRYLRVSKHYSKG